MYLNGDGIPKNEAEAAKWYRKAAEHGDATAQHILGIMYEDGIGVSKDDKMAIKWYDAAVKQGNESARARLQDLQRKTVPFWRKLFN